MRRLRKWRPGESNRDSRKRMIRMAGRSLSVTVRARVLDGRLRYITFTKAGYGSSKSARCDRKYSSPGQTLRNKKHHVPQYKYVRANISDINFSFVRSVNPGWKSSRVGWIRLTRETKDMHPDYMENNLQPHWWRI